MPRVSISLPKELMTKLEPIKVRLNISQVCREALERRITIFDQTAVSQKDGLDMETLVTRLREERMLTEGKWENLGKHNAGAWLGSASYVELKNVVEHQSISNMEKYKLPKDAFRMMQQDMKEAKSSLEGSPAMVYKTAWLDYVKEVWDQIQQHVEGSEESQTPEISKSAD